MRRDLIFFASLKHIIYFSGFCLALLACLPPGKGFASGPGFKQQVDYHYILSPEGAEYPLYLHISSPDGLDPVSRKMLNQQSDKGDILTDDSHGMSLVWHKSPGLAHAFSPRSLRVCLRDNWPGSEPEHRALVLPEPGKLVSFSGIEGSLDIHCSRLAFAGQELPLQQTGAAEGLPAQAGQSGYSIWLIDRKKRELDSGDDSFGIPEFGRKGGKPFLKMDGGTLYGGYGGGDDTDDKKRPPWVANGHRWKTWITTFIQAGPG